MKLQHERIADLCDCLNLPLLAQGYVAATQKATIAYSVSLKGLLREDAAGSNVRKQSLMTRLAGFPVVKTLDQFSYDFAKGASPIAALARLGFVERHENVVQAGPSDAGKTHLAMALGCKAMQTGIETRFTTAAKLMLALATAHRQNNLKAVMRRAIKAFRLLIINEISYLPMNLKQANLFLQAIAALLDRLPHHAHIVPIAGESYQQKHQRQAAVMRGGDAAEIGWMRIASATQVGSSFNDSHDEICIRFKSLLIQSSLSTA